ncbi:MAG: extracellular solute-binding protein [Rhodobacteraceae bacterium]|nr:extracellular solute-binding protein [Paracoccaceae bacterium]
MPVARAFKEATGIDFRIELSEVDNINADLILEQFSGKSRFDVALPATFGLPDLVSAGAIRDVSAYARRYEPPGFRDGILYRVGDSFDEKTYGFQADGDAYVMFYHMDLLTSGAEQARYADRFGVALKPARTWQELDRQMAYFHRPDDGLWGGLLFRTPGYIVWEWWVRFHAQGMWPFTPDVEPLIATPTGVAVLEDMIAATQYLHPDTSHLGLFGNMARFAEGNTFCNIGWGGSQKHFNKPQSRIKDRIVFGPTPGGFVDDSFIATPYFNWGWDYVVTSSSQMPEIAYLFSLFASSPEMSTLAVRQADGYFDPIRPEHYRDPGIVSAYSEAFLDVHRASLEEAIPDLYLAGQGDYLSALSDMILLALNREVTADVAMRRAAEKWDLITRRIGRDAQIRRWRFLQKKYPATVRSLLRYD